MTSQVDLFQGPAAATRPDAGRRYLSLWLPRLSTDRIERRMSPEARARPRATIAPEKGALRLAALNDPARALGLTPGLALADARARHPALDVSDADPAADARLLELVADAGERYTPLLALQPPDGLLLDVSGCAHLFGGEVGLLRDLLRRVRQQGYGARAALAATPGAASALARFGQPAAAVVPAGEDLARLLAPLPVAALRLPADTLAALTRLGFAHVGDLLDKPRAPLTARFGPQVLLRLDQALGATREALTHRFPPPRFCTEKALFDPIQQVDDVLGLAAYLAGTLAPLLERAGLGARRLELSVFRVDGQVTRLAVGSSRPVRDPHWVRRLFAEKVAALDSLEPGFGFDLLRLCVLEAAPLAPQQQDFDAGAAVADAALEHLVDRLSARLGARRVERLMAADSHLPEEAVTRVPAQSQRARPFAPVPPSAPLPLPRAARTDAGPGAGLEAPCAAAAPFSCRTGMSLASAAPATPVRVALAPAGPARPPALRTTPSGAASGLGASVLGAHSHTAAFQVAPFQVAPFPARPTRTPAVLAGRSPAAWAAAGTPGPRAGLIRTIPAAAPAAVAALLAVPSPAGRADTAPRPAPARRRPAARRTEHRGAADSPAAGRGRHPHASPEPPHPPLRPGAALRSTRALAAARAACGDGTVFLPPHRHVPGFPLPGSPLPGSPLPGFPLPSSPLPSSPLAGPCGGPGHIWPSRRCHPDGPGRLFGCGGRAHGRATARRSRPCRPNAPRPRLWRADRLAAAGSHRPQATILRMPRPIRRTRPFAPAPRPASLPLLAPRAARRADRRPGQEPDVPRAAEAPPSSPSAVAALSAKARPTGLARTAARAPADPAGEPARSVAPRPPRARACRSPIRTGRPSQPLWRRLAPVPLPPVSPAPPPARPIPTRRAGPPPPDGWNA